MENEKKEKMIEMNENRGDGWANALSALGKSKDKTTRNYYDVPNYEIFTDEMLTDIYTTEGLGKKIISRPADDMTRAWFDIENDTEGVIQEELKRLKAHNHINYAIKMARCYRGAVVVMFFEGDFSEMNTPAPKNPRGIRFLRVYSAARIDISNIDIVNDFRSSFYDEVEIYPIRKRNGELMRVHTSRCLVFKGEEAADCHFRLPLHYRYWGTPVLMSIWDRLSNYAVTEKGVALLMQEAVIGKYTMKNLLDLLSKNTPECIDKIYTRMEIINASKSIANAVLLADGEEYKRDSITFAGIPEVIDRMMMNLSSVCGIPVSILFGRSPAGMNATGESDFQGYYDTISTQQDNWLIYPLKQLVDTIAIYLNISNPVINFNPLEEANEEQQAKIRKLNTESDKMDMDMGVYDVDDILERRGESPRDEPVEGGEE